jgi:hypothetical protein
MDNDDLQAASQRALVIVTLGTASLVAYVGFLAML